MDYQVSTMLRLPVAEARRLGDLYRTGLHDLTLPRAIIETHEHGRRYVAFESYATNLVKNDMNGVSDAFVHDRNAGKTTRLSVRSNGTEGDLDSYGPSISKNGNYVAFDSNATNLVNNATNGDMDVFWRGPL